MFSSEKPVMMALSCDERMLTIHLAISTQCWIVTDRRTNVTDGQKDMLRQHIRHLFALDRAGEEWCDGCWS